VAKPMEIFPRRRRDAEGLCLLILGGVRPGTGRSASHPALESAVLFMAPEKAVVG